MYGEEHACVHGSWIVPEVGISFTPNFLAHHFQEKLCIHWYVMQGV